MSKNKCLLQVENVNVYYGSIHAIKNISLQVNEGEIVTLIGANGAGKSNAEYHFRTAEAEDRQRDLRWACDFRNVRKQNRSPWNGPVP